MVNNRSVPANIVLPHIYYDNVETSLNWLTATFGFREYYRFEQPDGQLHGALLHLDSAWVMLKNSNPSQISPAKLGYSTQTLMIFVEDIDLHYERTKLAGANIVEALNETEYGERHYVVQDIEGHHWMFSKHVRDVSPDEWGAVIASSSM
ncbi:VOC family protein [Paenibacillus aceris]|uniref:Glyoxalase superfamily protein PhnB n=1 Tax=Paenibacillus aceris TaxID=869555 RepID=A0ABS4I1L4_9BACL|nr:VOC family protein [Paenibacillus aceris]MBP1964311.1 putative glyoxalase superfamily protein PhnB [Paenibacillus aceris]NHW36631.1 hypothetical protein [Paenibacillus aceris]